jgi:4-hydroxy-3-polyprenylbenzoate decarboxylase
METRAAAPRRLIVAITGATGAIYGIRLLETLRRLGGVESHLLISSAGWLNIQHELQLSKEDVHPLADVVHSVRDVGASIASGSFATDGMVVAPCSMKTLASVAHNMTAVTEMGGVIFPPLPAFYNQPASIDEMVDHTVARVLDLFALGPALSPAWQGLRGSQE